MSVERFRYDDDIVRKFLWATMIWGLVGMLVGVVIALQLAFWKANLGIPWLTFGRLRPLHTNAVVFAFAGNAFFSGMYYATQRLLKTRMYSDFFSRVHFWGWQLIIVAAAITLPLGYSTSKEYAELEWPIDLAITLIWVVMAINYFATIAKRRERHLYVAIWFFIASIVTVAVLHVVNSLEIPVTFLKSYSLYAGVQDALVQWWYGHNAVAFFLTTPFLGLMYYFMPKAAEGPIYSYRLSIIHFWSLIFLYIWSGPHHLLYTALPDWAQTTGMLLSLMLIAPSWGGMINGLLTLRGGWHKLRQDPILKFMVVAITFYGMSTFEGPMLSIKSLNSLAHYTDWIIAHVHSGALGWNGFLTFGMTYWLIPRLYGRPLFSTRLANAHFWLGLLGILIYMLSMYIAGLTQGLMQLDFDNDGYLVYPNFMETVIAVIPFYWLRMLGGTMYMFGVILMLVNVIRTTAGYPVPEDTEAEAAPFRRTKLQGAFHNILETKPFQFTMWTTVAVLIGGAVEIIPMLTIESNVPSISNVKPYTPLELVGRDLYIREGCNNCHSQMVRPLRAETERYGDYSKAGEFVYDHPFLWGSKRTGPDLHRIGGKYPNLWHLRHMEDPRTVVKDSIMPAYRWLLERRWDDRHVADKVRAMSRLGVPYDRETLARSVELAREQAESIGADLAQSGVDGMSDKEIVALIAYLQRLGTDIKIQAER